MHIRLSLSFYPQNQYVSNLNLNLRKNTGIPAGILRKPYSRKFLVALYSNLLCSLYCSVSVTLYNTFKRHLDLHLKQRTSTVRGLEKDQVIQIGRLIGIKKFEGERERERERFNTFTDFKSVNRFENGSDMSGFRNLDNSTSKKVLNQLT